MLLYYTTDIQLDSGEMVRVTPRTGMRNITLRRNAEGVLRASVPMGYDLDEARRSLSSMILAPQMAMPRATRQLYSLDTVIECPDLVVSFEQQSHNPHHVILCHTRIDSDDIHPERIHLALGIWKDSDLADRNMEILISDILKKEAAIIARKYVIYRAIDIADKLRVKPSEWKIGRGIRTLGTCHFDGSITLSANLLFLPEHLQTYVIAHELAHLTEMNHSPRFHQLLNQYLGGREEELKAELKAFRWPILR